MGLLPASTRIGGWRFTVEKEDADTLRAVLTGALGARLVLRRRGTKRARMIVAIVAQFELLAGRDCPVRR